MKHLRNERYLDLLKKEERLEKLEAEIAKEKTEKALFENVKKNKTKKTKK